MLCATASAEECGLPLGVVGQLLPGWRGVSPEDPCVVGEVGEALLALAADRPVLVCVDDAQHADRLSLRCLAYAARRAGSRSLRVVLAADGGDDYYRRFEAQLGRLPHFRHVRLSTVELDEVGELVSGDGVPVAEVHRISGGNLLLLDALVEDFRATGRAEPGERFGEAVRDYLGRCDPETAAVLKALSVLSVARPLEHDREAWPPAPERGAQTLASQRRAWPPAPDSIVSWGTDNSGGAALVGAVAGIGAVEGVVRRLEEAGLLERGGFRHRAVPEAVVGVLSAAERERLHGKAARVLHDGGACPTVVAPHLLAAGVRGGGWGISVLVSAAAVEVERHRVGVAVALLETAGQRGGVRYDVVARLAEVEWRVSPVAAYRRLGDLVEAQRRGELSQVAAVALVGLLVRLDRVAEARDALELLVGAVRRDGPECPAALTRLRLLVEHFHPSLLTSGVRTVLRAELSPAAIAAAPHLEAFTLLRRVLAVGPSGGLVACVEHILRTHAVDESTVDSVVAGVRALIGIDRLVEAAAVVDRAADEPAVRCSPTWRAEFAFLRSVIAWRAGDLAACVEHGEAALSHLGETEWGVRVGGPRAALVLAHTAMGHHDAAGAILDRPVPPELFDTAHGLFYLHARGNHHLATGRLHDARRDFEVSAELARRLRLDPAPLSPWRTDLAALHLRHGNHRLARRYAEQELAKAPRTPSHARGTALRLLAATAPARDRVALLTEAREVLDACGAKLELARVLHDLAQAHQAEGDTERARIVERRAWHLARQCGAELSPPRLVLATAGTRTPDPAHVLSDAELRVSALAARGLTNREIAERLYVTVSTVEQHLTKAYRKLKVTGREALPPRLSPAVAEPA
ncbi:MULTISPECIES: helix-turn-helix transcriptional regulator [unclassified Saccharothrix]|uniref:helix-turn-helix transcriptional regulator n=1 Tax=unclassified Saccharothrix TaxID=2593673 RepID=UPI00307E73BD